MESVKPAAAARVEALTWQAWEEHGPVPAGARPRALELNAAARDEQRSAVSVSSSYYARHPAELVVPGRPSRWLGLVLKEPVAAPLVVPHVYFRGDGPESTGIEVVFQDAPQRAEDVAAVSEVSMSKLHVPIDCAHAHLTHIQQTPFAGHGGGPRAGGLEGQRRLDDCGADRSAGPRCALWPPQGHHELEEEGPRGV